ncbi:hypothetical protein FRC96_08610 [Lujinxingia vulgaris]|uniref:Uncharacterized protein n=1 Tax=Lujinxingia vulgaris TaxID=2600176 RepID=A0A5C6X8W0_9DELT|nr:hypothetical protein [Lujinxingia vulgaris]TXD36775.1 hypothetical protein FRC96_08610 [Lujinxingia vulgaris]
MYQSLNAHIDEIWTSEAFDCVIAEPEIVAYPDSGVIQLSLDVTNVCGEELLVVAERDGSNGERVGDGQLVRVRADLLELMEESEGEGEVNFYAITETERLSNAPEPAPHRALARIRYSYKGTLREHDDWCGEHSGLYGCATSKSHGPEGPLTFVGVALAGLMVRRQRIKVI